MSHLCVWDLGVGRFGTTSFVWYGWGGGDGVVLSSLVRSMKSCFGGIMTSLCLLALVCGGLLVRVNKGCEVWVCKDFEVWFWASPTL